MSSKHSHTHSHSHHDHFKTREIKKKKLSIALGINLVVMILEIVGGFYTNSLALLSDAGHMFTHIFALGLSYLAITLANKPVTEHKSFGYYRAEVLAAFINGIFLLLITGLIFYEAIHLMINPATVKTKEMIIIAIVGLITNIISVFLLSSSTKDDLNIKAAFVHVIGDAASSIIIIIGAMIIYSTGFNIIDPILSILISILILIWSVNLLKESVYILLEFSPKGIKAEKIKNTLQKKIPEVSEVHDIHIWVLTSDIFFATVHVVIKDMLISKSKEILNRAQQILHEEFHIEHANIQFELKDEDCGHKKGVFSFSKKGYSKKY